MPIKKLRKFLDDSNVKYVTIGHSPAYTAQEIAASAHITGREVAKTVIVNVDGSLAMAVTPATERIDFDALKESIGAGSITLAEEEAFADRFPQCEVGAMPPFGNLYEMDVYVEQGLAEDDEIAFNAGTHTELIRMAYADFDRLVQPKIARFAAGTPA